MGSDNRALWRYLKIFANQHGVCFFIQHPVRPNDVLCFMPDVPHVLKSCNRMLLSNKVIRLPPCLVQEENLPSDTVELAHVKDLLNREFELELKVAHRLTDDALNGSEHFDKMKVSNSKRVISNKMSSGLQLMALEKQKSEYLTTAWFIGLCNRWFDLMTNRSRKLALSKQNKEAYGEALNTIEKTARVFQRMRVGPKKEWKPVQTWVILASFVILHLQDYFLNKCYYVFILTGRFTQDFLENLFSCIRFRQSIPHALAFKNNIKVITLAQYCSASLKSSYDQDDGELIDLLTFSKEKAALRKAEKETTDQVPHEAHVPQLTDEHIRRFVSDWELLVLHDVAEAVLRSLKEVYKTCDDCFGALLWKGDQPHPYATVTRLNQYKEGATLEVSDECFVLLCKAELTFRMMRDTLRENRIPNIYEFLGSKLSYLRELSAVPNCHKIWPNYLRRFFTQRYRIYGQKRRTELDKENSCHKNSKSMAMHKNTK